jgi:chitin synthase
VSLRLESSTRLTPLFLSSQFNAYQLFFSWFALANVWLTFTIIVDLVPALANPIYLFGTADIVSFIASRPMTHNCRCR